MPGVTVTRPTLVCQNWGVSARALAFSPMNGTGCRAMINTQANVPRVNGPTCEIRQVRVSWAEDGSRFTEAFEALRSRS